MNARFSKANSQFFHFLLSQKIVIELKYYKRKRDYLKLIKERNEIIKWIHMTYP